MKYWAHINNELQGPFEKEEVRALKGFGPETLICPETPAAGEAQAWKPASSCADLFPAAAAPEAPKPAPAESPLAMTMRGTLIEPQEKPAAPPVPAPGPQKPKAEESPLMMTMRGTLVEPPEETAAAPAPPKPAIPAPGEKAQPKAGDPLSSLAEGQARLADRLERVEKLLLEMRSLLFPGLQKKD